MIARSCAVMSFCGVLSRSMYSSTLATSLALRSLPCTLSSFPRVCLCRLPLARVLLLDDNRAAILVQEDRGTIGATDDGLLVVVLRLLNDDSGARSPWGCFSA